MQDYEVHVKYNETLFTLETVLDSFFENYVKWMKANPQHEYRTYNVSFGSERPKRTPENIEVHYLCNSYT